MKTLKYFLAAVIAVTFSVNSFAASKTEKIKVSGNCESCKVRIEKAAKIDGVAKAEWDSKTKNLTLVYDDSKVKSDDIQKAIATVGHDTPKFKADSKAYNALPGCCKYKTK